MIDPREASDWLDRGARLLGPLGSRQAWLLGCLLFLLVLVEIARSRIARWIARWRLRRQSDRALQAEAWAERLLAGSGYRVLGSQVRGTYDLLIDGHPVTIALRVDYIVERRGRSFVAEVKSGQLAPSLETASTRRQLLEYRIAFAVDGVLLIDGETGAVHEVVFPAERHAPAVRLREARLG